MAHQVNRSCHAAPNLGRAHPTTRAYICCAQVVPIRKPYLFQMVCFQARMPCVLFSSPCAYSGFSSTRAFSQAYALIIIITTATITITNSIDHGKY